MKLSDAILHLLQELGEAEREAVEDIVSGHIQACRTNGMKPSNLESVYKEAIEVIKLEGPAKKETMSAAEKYEPLRNYGRHYSIKYE